MATISAPTGAIPPTARAHTQLVIDALILLNYAIEGGVKSADGQSVQHGVVTAIETTAGKLGLFDGKPGETASALTAEEWADFDLAYYDLAIALAPVTAETLRNTAGRPPGMRTYAELLLGDSPALRFTRKLWLGTLCLAIFVVGANIFSTVIATNPNTEQYLWPRTALELLSPWMYGGLGACVYLLRSAHIYIYQRTFDIRRKPEFTNRIMLGAIAGGAIIMFTNNIAGDDGTVVQLSSAALGFLAGYNTDLLFSAMERVTTALLPKIGIDTVAKASPSIRPVDVNALVDQAVQAKGTEKDHIHALTAHVTGMRARKHK